LRLLHEGKPAEIGSALRDCHAILPARKRNFPFAKGKNYPRPPKLPANPIVNPGSTPGDRQVTTT